MIVTLIDGQEVASDSEAWRAECEARAVLAIPGIDRRREHLALVEKIRGKPAADRLRADMMAIWKQGQA